MIKRLSTMHVLFDSQKQIELWFDYDNKIEYKYGNYEELSEIEKNDLYRLEQWILTKGFNNLSVLDLEIKNTIDDIWFIWIEFESGNSIRLDRVIKANFCTVPSFMGNTEELSKDENTILNNLCEWIGNKKFKHL